MDRIEKEAIRMGELVEDLLELARLDEAEAARLAPVDLRADRPGRRARRAARPARLVTVVAPTVAEPRCRLEPRRPDADAGRPRARRATQRHRRSRAPGAIARAAAARASRRSRRRRAGAASAADRRRSPGCCRSRARSAAPIVLGEENKIRQVVTNLMGNAMRFTPETARSRSRSGRPEPAAA